MCLSVNLVILVLLAVAFLIIVQRNLLNLSDFYTKKSSGAVPEPQPGFGPRSGGQIPVLITAAEDRLGAAVSAIHSVYSNTKANVVFTIVTRNSTVQHLKRTTQNSYINPEQLKGKISQDPHSAEATKPLAFARFYLPLYIPEADRAIYLDDDVIVQGDIQEANTCTFNPGVFVANLSEWRNQNITGQLQHWMKLNTQEDLYSKTLGDSVITPPLLIVFYKRHSAIDPMWHIRHLGTTGAANRYSSQFVKAAKLLHWNGHYKPWGRGAAFTDLWDHWYIQDPTGKFHPIRRHADDDKE
uniref:Glycosyltransferase 8 domain-containing protein 1 n=1 Tax=Neogobius melanostomus TaxID=47308 RepID=A0A8C6SG63_9GOBI